MIKTSGLLLQQNLCDSAKNMHPTANDRKQLNTINAHLQLYNIENNCVND